MYDPAGQDTHSPVVGAQELNPQVTSQVVHWVLPAVLNLPAGHAVLVLASGHWYAGGHWVHALPSNALPEAHPLQTPVTESQPPAQEVAQGVQAARAPVL